MEKAFSIYDVDKIIEDNLQNSALNGAFIANQLGMSRMQLHRQLRRFLNTNTRDYIKSKRIEKAKELLRTTNYSVQNTAFLVGFSSLGYFSRVFKESVGVNPSEFK